MNLAPKPSSPDADPQISLEELLCSTRVVGKQISEGLPFELLTHHSTDTIPQSASGSTMMEEASVAQNWENGTTATRYKVLGKVTKGWLSCCTSFGTQSPCSYKVHPQLVGEMDHCCLPDSCSSCTVKVHFHAKSLSVKQWLKTFLQMKTMWEVKTDFWDPLGFKPQLDVAALIPLTVR